jgi:hypothetical protein
MDQTTLCITATVFDDATRLAYSVLTPDTFSPIHQCEATEQAWWYLLDYLPATYLPADYAVRLAVIDRRPGTVATSRSLGTALTTERIPAEVAR